MLYKFKSKNAGDVIMLEPNGRQVLEIIGKAPGAKGIILAAEMPAAIEAIRAAVVQDEQAERERDEESRRKAQEAGSVHVSAPAAVSLRHRTLPFVDMLQRCHKRGDDIVWGV
ncbi:MAG: DUF1840 domain-containing protein [Pseudomonadota bacterium]